MILQLSNHLFFFMFEHRSSLIAVPINFKTQLNWQLRIDKRYFRFEIRIFISMGIVFVSFLLAYVLITGKVLLRDISILFLLMRSHNPLLIFLISARLSIPRLFPY